MYRWFFRSLLLNFSWRLQKDITVEYKMNRWEDILSWRFSRYKTILSWQFSRYNTILSWRFSRYNTILSWRFSRYNAIFLWRFSRYNTILSWRFCRHNTILHSTQEWFRMWWLSDRQQHPESKTKKVWLTKLGHFTYVLYIHYTVQCTLYSTMRISNF